MKWFATSGVAFLAVVLAGCSPATPPAADVPQAPAAQVEPAAPVTFGLTPAQYATRMNRYLQEAGLKARLPAKPKMTFSNDESESYRQTLGQQIGLIVRVNKATGFVDDVTLFAMPNGTDEQAADVMLAACAVYAAALPGEHPLKAGGQHVPALMKAFKEDTAEAAELKTQGVRLWHLRGDPVGVLFGASPA